MIRLRVSQKGLRIAGWSAFGLVLLAGLYWLGVLVTPLDADGRPLILSPSLRAAERYRARARGWVERMAEVDGRLDALLMADEEAGSVELYERGREMQAVGEKAASLAGEVQVAEVTVAMFGLREQVKLAADAYLAAAISTSRWLNAPSEAGRREALSLLHSARAQRIDLEENQWLGISN